MASISLSTCWNSGRHTDGEVMLKEIRDLGFDYAELGHGIRYSLLPGVIKAVESGVVKLSSLHNFCPVPMGILHPSPNCYQFSDEKLSLRNLAIQSTKDTIQQAEKLGAPAVVLHLGWAGPDGVTNFLEENFSAEKIFGRKYVAAKIDAVRQRKQMFPEVWERIKGCLDPIVEYAGQHQIKLGFECRELFEEFPNDEEMPEVLSAFPSEIVGYWHDFGHAARKDFLGWHTHEETLARHQDRLWGCHIHDCSPPYHDHKALGEGEINLKRLSQFVSSRAIQVLELSPNTTAEQVVRSKKIWNSFVNILA
jgi:sugar phosphate isomerase/epimerase